MLLQGPGGIRLGTTDGSRVAIRLLQEAAERGDLDPWDVDVIAVVDGFLDQLQVRMALPRLVSGSGGSYEKDLAESSEAFLAASVLVALKARVLEQDILPPDVDGDEEDVLDEGDDLLEVDGSELVPRLPLHAEEHLKRRLVAPPPLRRTVTLGELIQSLETMATQLEQQEVTSRRRNRTRPFSRSHAVAQVAALAHREKLPETTAALDQFLDHWADGGGAFEELVSAWAQVAPDDLDRDRVGVFWALLFLCSQGRVDLRQDQGLYGPITIQALPRPQVRQEPQIRQEAQAAPRRLAVLRMAPQRAA